MNAFLFGLVLLSACLHVFWNALVKSCRDKLAFAWLTTMGGGAFLAVCFAVSRMAAPGPLPAAVWMWAGLSGLMQAVYVVLLFAAYKASDLSVVYPMCRGLPPLFLMALAGRLVGDTVSSGQGLAVGFIVAGTLAVGLTNRNSRGAVSGRGIALSLVAALSTTGYSLIDRIVMSLPEPPSAMEYLFLCYLPLAGLLTLVLLHRRPRLQRVLAEYRRNPRAVLLVSVFTPLAYLCIVFALRFGNVVLIAAARNVGILLSTLAGVVFLHERVTRGRVAGAVLVSVGVTALTLGG